MSQNYFNFTSCLRLLLFDSPTEVIATTRFFLMSQFFQFHILFLRQCFLSSKKMSSSSLSRFSVLSLYSKLLRTAKRLDEPSETLRKIRSAFKSHSKESDPNVLSKLMDEARSKLAFLELIAPERQKIGNRAFDSTQSSNNDGRIVFHWRDGKIVEGPAPPRGKLWM